MAEVSVESEPVTNDLADSQQNGAQEASGGLQDALKAAHDSQTPSAPLREDQVANAVSFLTNEKVVVRGLCSKRFAAGCTACRVRRSCAAHIA